MKIKNWSKIKEGTLLLITWHDIVNNNSWVEYEKAKKQPPCICKDIGWFVNEDKLNVRITNSTNTEGELSITVIPKGCIRGIQKIKYEREKKKK